jgi:hypothetical protein
MRDNAAGVLIADPARNPDFEPLVFAVIVMVMFIVQSLPPRMITRFKSTRFPCRCSSLFA